MRRRRAHALAAALLAAPACRASGLDGELADPCLAPGTWALHARTGVFADYEAESSLEVVDVNFGAGASGVATELEGRLGLQLGAERAFADGLSLLAGVDLRRFEPSPIEGFVFEEIDYRELFVALRWTLPWRLDGARRLAPFAELELGWVPEVRFDGELDLQSQGAMVPNPPFAFDGSGYLHAGLALGLAYRWSPTVVLHATALHEWPLGATEDTVEVDLGLGPAVPPIRLETELEPAGLVVWLGSSWRF